MDKKNVSPILVDAGAAANALGISRSTLYSLRSADQLPAPVKLRGAVRWRFDELSAWADAGCPAREKWEAMKAAGRGNRN